MFFWMGHRFEETVEPTSRVKTLAKVENFKPANEGV